MSKDAVINPVVVVGEPESLTGYQAPQCVICPRPVDTRTCYIAKADGAHFFRICSECLEALSSLEGDGE